MQILSIAITIPISHGNYLRGANQQGVRYHYIPILDPTKGRVLFVSPTNLADHRIDHEIL